MTNNQTHDSMDLVHRLITSNHESERNFFSAAEQAENRGVKLLLKAYAQQRVEFARQLQGATEVAVEPQRLQSDPTQQTENQGASAGFFRRGWVSLTSAMVIQRQHRQQTLISDLLRSEADIVNLYESAMNQTASDGTLRGLIEQQQAQIRIAYENLGTLAKEDNRRLVLRLFNEKQTADQAVRRLQETVKADDKIVEIPIETVPVYYNNQQEQNRSTREAIVTGGLTGAIFGGVLGMIYGIYHWIALSDILPGFLATTAAGVIWELALYGALLGLLFSVIFSAFVTRNNEEIDDYLYAEGIREGNVLVAVFADKAEAAIVRRTIGLKHEHEVEPVPA